MSRISPWYITLWFSSGADAREAADLLGLDRRRVRKLPRNYSRDHNHYGGGFAPGPGRAVTLTHTLRFRDSLLDERPGVLAKLRHEDDEATQRAA